MNFSKKFPLDQGSAQGGEAQLELTRAEKGGPIVGEATLDDAVQRMHAVGIAMGRIAPMRDPIADAIACEISAAQIHALMRLGHDGALTMGVLAARVGITLPACTRLMDRMLEQNLVTRERDPEDRRVVHIAIAPEGQRLFETIDSAMQEKLGALLSLLQPEDRQSFVGLLEKLLYALSEKLAVTPPNNASAALASEEDAAEASKV